MKLSIAQRLALILALTGVLASGLTGYYAYTNSRNLLVAAAEERMRTQANVLIRQVVEAIDGSSRDVRILAGHPRITQALQDTSASAAMQNDVAALFSAMLKTHPEYFQIRLISAAGYGMEQVRIDRDSASLLRVPIGDLQEKGHYPYVFETLRLAEDEIYLSTPVINHELGAHAGQDKPSMQVATPVFGTEKDALGIVVINLDMNNLFQQLSADLPQEIGLYLTNRQGDFLLHPDSSQAFAFDQGRRVLIQEQFPFTAALIKEQVTHVMNITKASNTQGEDMVAAFVRQTLKPAQQEAFFILGLSQPLRSVLKESDSIGKNILRMVIAFSVLSMLLAGFVARAITAPVRQIERAVNRFTNERIRDPLPVTRSDEIGLLAREIDDMQQQIQAQVNALQEKQVELDHLASHDSLTGLINRRMFLERLDLAMARAKRNNGSMAMLFIDLDKFKEINDSLGHAIGDMVLHTVAERIYPLVREVDSVARLGGDEFVILLDGADNRSAIAQVANKVLEAVAQPIPWSGKSLRIGASIGIAQYPQDGLSASEIVSSADKAMYLAKETSRNSYCFASQASKTV